MDPSGAVIPTLGWNLSWDRNGEDGLYLMKGAVVSRWDYGFFGQLFGAGFGPCQRPGR